MNMVGLFTLFCTWYLANSAVVVNTWPWPQATSAAWITLSEGGSVVDAVEKGCTQCEIDQCGQSVGFGGSPDENGETTLDAMIMDGKTQDAGAVGCLRRIKNAISVARHVMEHTTHTFLVGDLATDFAFQMGFQEQSLQTPLSYTMWQQWKQNACQPNYWNNVTPNHMTSCGPYTPLNPSTTNPNSLTDKENARNLINSENHDTIAMIALDENGDIAVGTSTNGLNHKIPGRVGDSPIIGSGAYVDNDIGGCGATGDGDVMMRFLPCYQAVESMRQGMSPTQAAEYALLRIKKFYPQYEGAIVTLNKNGQVGAAAHGWSFQYTYQSNVTGGKPVIVNVPPMS